MKFKMFQNSQPTSAQIDEQIAAARNERQQLETCNEAILDELASAYGADTPATTKLEAERQRNTILLQVVEKAIMQLGVERRAAMQREAGDQFRAMRGQVTQVFSLK